MARKLRPDEEAIFNAVVGAAKLPTHSYNLQQSWAELQDESAELTLVSGMWLDDSAIKPSGS